jgi:outer membrane lipoprotein-sorting protein
MSRLSLPRPSSRRLRWGVPVAAAAVLIGIGPAVAVITADAHGSLPPRTAAQLLADVHAAKVQALSGTVVETSDLGLPSLPDVGGAGGDSASFSSLVSGSHTMRLWYSGPDRVRLALLGQLGESDLVRNGTDLWAWSSGDNTATHWTVPTGSARPMAPGAAAGAAMTPQTTDPTAEVAGRPAYQLDLVPRDSRSLVGSVRIAIDGETHVPSRVQVFARGATRPAFQIGFTSFSTATPPASTFAFEPPPGATVKEGQAPTARPTALRHADVSGAAPQVLGRGWTTVVVADVGDNRAGLPAALSALPTVSGSWGSGNLLRGTVFSAVLTDDGRVAVGAVPPAMLYAALGRR